ncbi:DUF1194 domain-containing protein [Azospirillum sp.]|uniref:DUF1194 domain-containing protein n=1 Tax=Azospirillum sp. TaxID=34012 RepID=UPI00261D723C|nr:DUF1194 domain-containing protein [Azospirillum sp.]
MRVDWFGLWRRGALGFALVWAAAGWAADAHAWTSVDLELVLAIDASASVEDSLLDFQLSGHAAAFRDPSVVAAIGGGSRGKIAVTLVSWSDPTAFEVLIPWTQIGAPDSVLAFAAAIDALPRRDFAGSTGIGAAMLNAADQFRFSGASSPRRVIDLVSNGFNNIGIMPEYARDQVLAQGITINGLVILDQVPWLTDYFAARVIGGPSAFVRAADDRRSFARAILDKLRWEIATAADR